MSFKALKNLTSPEFFSLTPFIPPQHTPLEFCTPAILGRRLTTPRTYFHFNISVPLLILFFLKFCSLFYLVILAFSKIPATLPHSRISYPFFCISIEHCPQYAALWCAQFYIVHQTMWALRMECSYLMHLCSYINWYRVIVQLCL